MATGWCTRLAAVVLTAVAGLFALAGEAQASSTPEPDIVQTGQFVPGLEPYDRIVARTMRDHRIPGAAVAVVRHGHLVYARGFGMADRLREGSRSTGVALPYREPLQAHYGRGSAEARRGRAARTGRPGISGPACGDRAAPTQGSTDERDHGARPPPPQRGVRSRSQRRHSVGAEEDLAKAPEPPPARLR